MNAQKMCKCVWHIFNSLLIVLSIRQQRHLFMRFVCVLYDLEKTPSPISPTILKPTSTVQIGSNCFHTLDQLLSINLTQNFTVLGAESWFSFLKSFDSCIPLRIFGVEPALRVSGLLQRAGHCEGKTFAVVVFHGILHHVSLGSMKIRKHVTYQSCPLAVYRASHEVGGHRSDGTRFDGDVYPHLSAFLQDVSNESTICRSANLTMSSLDSIFSEVQEPSQWASNLPVVSQLLTIAPAAYFTSTPTPTWASWVFEWVQLFATL